MPRAIARILIAVLAVGCTSGQRPGASTLAPRDTASPPAATSTTTVVVPSPPASLTARSTFAFRETLRRDDAILSDIVAYEGGFIAVGCVRFPPEPPTEGPCERGLILRSPDGRSWRELAVPGAEQRWITAVADTPLGLLAFAMTQESEPPRSRAAWRSLNGDDWEPFTIDAPSAVLFDLGVALDGATVLFGADSGYDFGVQTEAWATTDGRTWTHGTAPLTPKVATSSGVIAVGVECVDLCAPDQALSVWRSSDGLTWLADSDVPAEMAGLSPAAVVGYDGRTVVAGTASLEAGSGETVVWQDAPGGWERATIPDALGATAGRLLVIGTTMLLTAERQADGQPLAWSSIDGQAWTPAHVDGVEGATIAAWAGSDPFAVVVDESSIWLLEP